MAPGDQEDGGDASSHRSPEERLEALETAVAELQTGLLALRDAVWRQQTGAPPPPGRAPTAVGPSPTPPSPAPAATPTPRPSRRTPRPRRERAGPDWDAALTSGDWLNRAGVALLLVGVAFLFKYASDRGWITPGARVGFGLALGSVLILLGARLRATRAAYALVLSGGGIATLYMTVFAAFSLYGLVPYGLAFGAMVAVTAGSFALALRDDAPVHALIGTVGGLGTPFLLYTPEGSVPGLVVYTCALLAGAAAVYAARGWRVLLAVAAVGGWVVLGIATDAAEGSLGRPGPGGWAVQLGIGVAAALTWGVCVLRERAAAFDEQRLWLLLPYQLTAATPFVALALSAWLWGWDEREGALACFAAAALWVGAWRALGGGLGFAHAVVAVALATVGLVAWLDGDAEIFALGAEALALHVVAQRLGSHALAVGGHALWLGVVGLLTFRLVGSAGGMAAATDLALIVGLAAAARFVLPRGTAPLYLLVALGAWLSWLYRELDPLANGQAWVSAAWIATGAALLVAGLLRDHVGLRRAAAATLVAAIAKLFLVDLAEVEMLWRSLVFMGFGAVLLVLGYLFPSLWRRTGETP